MCLPMERGEVAALGVGSVEGVEAVLLPPLTTPTYS